MVFRLIWISNNQWWDSLFSVLDQKNSFLANLVQKIKVVSISWNLVPKLIQIWQFNYNVHFFCFRPWISLSGEFGSKIQNCLFTVKFDTKTKSNTQHSEVMSILSLCVNLVQKFKRVNLRRNLKPRLIWICKNLWWWYFFYFGPFLQVLPKN